LERIDDFLVNARGAGSIQVVKREKEKNAVPKCGLPVCSRAAFAILLGKVNEPTDSLDQFLSLAVRRSIVLRKRRRAAEYAEYRTANARL
jgi:hypothetical protein